MTQPIYAVGDIHGQLHELERVLALIDADGGADATIVFLGDYVDRGLQSKAVVQRLMDGAAHSGWTCLKGNHDRYLTRFYDNGTDFDPCTRTGLKWFNPKLGGDKTLLSYGIVAEEGMDLAPIHETARGLIPEDQMHFLRDCAHYHETEDLIFVHAGIRPGIPMADQKEDDLLWIRDGFLDFKGSFGKLIVHGHTSLDHPSHAGNRVNLDGGAGLLSPASCRCVRRDRLLVAERSRPHCPDTLKRQVQSSTTLPDLPSFIAAKPASKSSTLNSWVMTARTSRPFCSIAIILYHVFENLATVNAFLWRSP